MTPSGLLWRSLCGVAASVCLATAAPAQRFPAPDPPRVDRRLELPLPAPEPGPSAPPGPLRAPTVEWAGHRSPDGQHPDGDEQAVVWLMNRARQNPAAEGVFLATSSEPDVAGGREFFLVNLGVLQTEFALLLPKPPAAFDARLYAAALAHSLDLIARDAQDHVGQFDRIDAAGFQFTDARVSVFSFADNALNAHAALNIDWGPGTARGPGRTFAVPNATALDPAAASPIIVAGTGLTAVVPASFASGSYQVRVIGLTATGQPLGRASDAVTLVIP